MKASKVAARIAAAGFFLSGASALAYTQEPEAVPGEYVVKLKENILVSQDINVLSRGLGVTITSRIPSDNIVVVKKPAFQLQSSAVKSLSEHPWVEIAEPNYIYRIKRVPNDPMLGQLWGMINSGQADSAKKSGVPGVDIGAEQAWDIQTGSRDIVVAVIDTGINYNSADLKPNMWVNEAEASGKTGVDDDGNGIVDDIHGAAFTNKKSTGNPLDDHGHGSHCAGPIGAKGDDGKGIVGVAWNVRLMGIKFLTKDGGGTLEDAIKSIDYATKMGANIMSNSWGGGGYSETLKAAIERANKVGILFVAAAGNEANNNDAKPTYPATYSVPNVLSVAAVDNQGRIASFSNYGKNTVHVGAPGVNIYSTTTTGYDSWSGTSMATPHVSGIAALIVSQFPKMTHLELRERIITTAKPLSGLRGKVRNAGFANAYTALTNTLPEPDLNDPANWSTVSANVASEHPYKEKTRTEFQVEVPGANQIALYFSRFETEAKYDKLEIYDSAGKLVETISGQNDNSFSQVITGSSAKLVFISDDTVNKWGFEITKIAYK